MFDRFDADIFLTIVLGIFLIAATIGLLSVAAVIIGSL